MKHRILAIAAMVVLSAPAMADYNYDAVMGAKEKEPLKQTIPGMVKESHRTMDHLSENTNRTYDRYESNNRSSSSSGNSAPNAYCSSGDTCFEVVSRNGNIVKIRCTKGARNPYDQNTEICGPNDKGRWASGCGIGSFHHYQTMREAGNLACTGDTNR